MLIKIILRNLLVAPFVLMQLMAADENLVPEGKAEEISSLHRAHIEMEKNPTQARAIYKELADAGDAVAQKCFGWCCQSGIGGDTDLTMAQAYYELSAAQHNPEALYRLGTLYSREDASIPQDYARAVNYFKQGAILANAASCHDLAVLYYYGRGVEQDMVEAKRLLKLTAEAQYPGAAYNLAQILLAEGKTGDAFAYLLIGKCNEALINFFKAREDLQKYFPVSAPNPIFTTSIKSMNEAGEAELISSDDLARAFADGFTSTGISCAFDDLSKQEEAKDEVEGEGGKSAHPPTHVSVTFKFTLGKPEITPADTDINPRILDLDIASVAEISKIKPIHDFISFLEKHKTLACDLAEAAENSENIYSMMITTLEKFYAYVPMAKIVLLANTNNPVLTKETFCKSSSHYQGMVRFLNGCYEGSLEKIV